ncbi:MAG TPA: pyruvate kinase [Terriglobales bacterium]|nr:pyruvate kinase [Terriglobales bacterium]
MRKAKIVCTVGPASASETVLRELVRAGMDVARLNFSHGSHEEHAARIRLLRAVAEKENRTLCILQDLQGPKIRTGRLKNHRPVVLRDGVRLTLTPRDLAGTAKLIPTTFPTLAREVRPGARILLADGLIELRVVAVHGADVECEVVNGGLLGEHKGINLPGTPLRVPSLTNKDLDDLAFGLRHGVDMVAVSFVRSARDVNEAKRRIAERGSDVPVIAKLEKPQAIRHLEEILEAADGVMVARGDLGVEMPAEQVPVIQKHIIKRAAAWRKPVITATQMLESMIEHPRPTRAEASDVANAIFDGTDAVMLSAETASGKYPREAVLMMARIIHEAESHMGETGLRRRREETGLSIAETICESVAHAAHNMEMRAIAVFTETGNTARLISKYRPKPRIFAFTASPEVRNRLNLLWGVRPMYSEKAPTSDDMVRVAEQALVAAGVARKGDVVGVVAGTTMASGSTNFMRLHVVGSLPGMATPTAKRKRKRRR